MPDAIASEPQRDIGIPRYKGKRANSTVPKPNSLTVRTYADLPYEGRRGKLRRIELHGA